MTSPSTVCGKAPVGGEVRHLAGGDLENYRQQQEKRRSAVMEQLAEEAQELGLGY